MVVAAMLMVAQAQVPGEVAFMAWVLLLVAGALIAFAPSDVLGAMLTFAERISRRSRTADLVGRVAANWLRRIPGVSQDTAGMVLPSEHNGGILLTLVTVGALLWALALNLQDQDRGVVVGMNLLAAGLGTVVVGLQAASLFQSWATAQIFLGAAVVVVSYYLVSFRPRIDPERPDGVHRVVLLVALGVIASSAAALAYQFRPLGPTATTALARAFFVAAGIGAMVTVAFASAGLVGHEIGRPKPTRFRARWFAVWDITRGCGVTCLLYAAGFIATSTLAPSLSLRLGMVSTAVFLCLAAQACFHRPNEFVRVFRSWLR